MSIINVYTKKELQLLEAHGLSTKNHSQLSDAFVIGYRKAKDEISPMFEVAEELYDSLENLTDILQSINSDPEVLNAYGCHYDNSDIRQALKVLSKARGEG